MMQPAPAPLAGGVCAGIAERFQVDVTLVRLTVLLLALAWGLGLVGYLVAWFLMPVEDASRGYGARARGRLHRLRRDARSSGARLSQAWARAGSAQRWPRPLSRRWMGLGLLAAGAAVLLESLGAFSWLSPLRALGLAAVAAGAAILLSLRSE